jgi:PAS domain S-box-containing protein
MAGRILECNAAYERLTGYTLEELKSLTYMELTPEAWHKAEERIVKEEILKKGASGIYDKEYRRKDGSLVPVELRTVLDRDAAGKPAGMWAIIRDVSERKAAVAALEKAKDYAESLIQTANAMVIVMDAEGRVTTFSKEAEKITGYTREELEGRSWFETIVPKDRYPEVWDEFNRLMAGGFPAKFDNMILTKSGEERYISWQNSQLTEDGRVTGTLSFGMDITERRRAEREIGTLNKVLQEKNLEMESFLYITTHDLRGPLVNIQGFSQNLQQYFGEIKELSARAGLPPSEKSRAEELAGIKIPESLTFILEGSARMDAMLTALLKVSRLGRQELKPELVDAGGLLRTLADTMSFQLREAGAEVKTGPLPPCRADALSVSQMFSNLLDNAVKYREPARPLVIEISGEEAAGKAVYRFRDNGRGIAAGDLDRIWEIFSAQQRAGEKKGEGIGLHMVKRMAGRNGGSIRAESEPGQGSVFIVELPVWEG